MRVEWEYDMESHCHLQSGNPAALVLQRKKVFEIQKCKTAQSRSLHCCHAAKKLLFLEAFAQLVS